MRLIYTIKKSYFIGSPLSHAKTAETAKSEVIRRAESGEEASALDIALALVREPARRLS